MFFSSEPSQSKKYIYYSSYMYHLHGIDDVRTWPGVLLQLLESFSNGLVFFTQAFIWHVVHFAFCIASMCKRF